MKRILIKRKAVAWGALALFFCLAGQCAGVLAAETVKGKTQVPATVKEKKTVAPVFTTAPFNGKRIGCLLPMTGTYASYGASARKGMDLALLTFMANGKGKGFKIEYRDTGSNPEKTRQAVRELADLGVCAILGPVGPAEEAAKEAQAFGIPIITLTGKEGITDLGEYVFRHFLTQGIQVSSVSDYAFNMLELKRFAVLYPDEPYGRDMMRLFAAEVKRRGGVLVAAESYAPKTTDFGKQIRKIVGAAGKKETTHPQDNGWMEAKNGIDAVFIPDSAETVGLILPQLRFYDVTDAVLLGTNLWHSDKLVSLAGKYLQQAVIPEGFFAESDEPQVVRFVERFREAYDRTPGYVEAVAYDTALIAFHVMAGKPTSHKDLRDKLLDMESVRGVTGITSFSETGEAEKMIYLLRGNADGFVEISK